MKNLYQIKFKPNAEGFYVVTPRHNFIPLQKAIIAKLEDMKANKVSSQVTQPTHGVQEDYGSRAKTKRQSQHLWGLHKED